MNLKQTVTALVASIACQLVVVVVMVSTAVEPLSDGTEVRVMTIPVDPRSMFRGNYARLRYPFGVLSREDLVGAEGLRVGDVVYVSLRPGDGELHEFAGASLEQPADGVFLRGRVAQVARNYQIEYGIEAFFAPRERALELEENLRAGGVAVLMVSDSGTAVLVDVIPGSPPD